MLGTILLVFAFVFFCIAACFSQNYGRFSFIAAGLAAWVLSILLAGHFR